MNTPNPSPQAFLPSRVTERRASLEAKRLEYWAKMKDPEAPWSHIRDLYEKHHESEDYRFLYYKFYVLSQVMLAAVKAHTLATREEMPLDSYTLTAQDLAPDLKEMFGSKFDEDSFTQASDIIFEKVMGDIPAE